MGIMSVFLNKELWFSFWVNFSVFPEHNGKARIQTDIHLIPLLHHVPSRKFNDTKLQILQVVYPWFRIFFFIPKKLYIKHNIYFKKFLVGKYLHRCMHLIRKPKCIWRYIVGSVISTFCMKRHMCCSFEELVDILIMQCESIQNFRSDWTISKFYEYISLKILF